MTHRHSQPGVRQSLLLWTTIRGTEAHDRNQDRRYVFDRQWGLLCTWVNPHTDYRIRNWLRLRRMGIGESDEFSALLRVIRSSW